MKKPITFLAASAIIFGFSVIGFTNSSQPPVAHTGAPGEMNCTMCHSGNPNSGTGSVTLLLPPANYVPGTTYTLTVKVTDATKSRFGFEIVALRSGNTQAGTFVLTNTANTVSMLNGTKRYVGHKNASSNSTWTFQWTAPATDVGPVTFYMAGNAANGNGSDSGDNIYTNSFVLSPAVVSGVQEDKNGFVSVFPNPASGKMFISLAEEIVGLKVLNIQGKEIFRNEKATNETQLDVSKFENGIYFLQLDMGKSSLVKRFVVQH